ncbi:MAG: gfo/Idh/MocA family oxidoreductase [Haliscomenobacteraceae bacterium CHB4]|nr:scyllo-inositol 2-dehydrogenase (NADP(+)) IolU [Saprospiraceae bacterium]MCE7922560.1 gfo/Idh/MocA family oxidoreductase [Haliscomenobacteraceae bacterium CHB4]
MRTYNWGIIGASKIARKFADDLKRLSNARLHAVASTSADRAAAFAAEYGAAHSFGRYEDMVHCPDLDIVYVATPHVLHCENTLFCLEHGIPVLCEKPFAMNSAEAHRMVAAARKNRVFLMEALWTRFIPAVSQVFELIEAGEIGMVHTVKSDFGFRMPFDPSHRIFNKALGGGSLLDIGIYPALLSLLTFGKPDAKDILAAATFTQTGVDESCAFSFRYPGNRLAIGHSTVAATTPVEAWLFGTEGTIYLHPRWHHTERLTVSRYEGRGEIKHDLQFPYEGWGYAFEAAHVMQCLENEMLESDKLPLDLTLNLVETLDDIRAKVGLEY